MSQDRVLFIENILNKKNIPTSPHFSSLTRVVDRRSIHMCRIENPKLVRERLDN